MINSFSLMGLTYDNPKRTHEGDRLVSQFILCVMNDFESKHVNYIPITALGENAKKVAICIKKNYKILVDGNIQTEYQYDKVKQKMVLRPYFVLDTFKVLDKPKKVYVSEFEFDTLLSYFAPEEYDPEKMKNYLVEDLNNDID